LTKKESEPANPSAEDRSGCKRLTIDLKAYEPYLADSDLTEEQKQEFLQALWSIIVAFVDLGFDIHPVQQVSGPETKIDELIASHLDNMLSSDQYFNDQLRDSVEEQPDPHQEREYK
jgi:hypothetical protein